MKVGSNRNINKAEVYHLTSSQSQSPSTPPEAQATPAMHSMKSSGKPRIDIVTILPVGNKKFFLKNTIMKN